MQVNELFLTIVVVVSLIAIFSYKAYRQRKSSWKGVLLKKCYFEDYEDGESTYTLIFRSTNGKKHKVKVKSKAEFDKWTEGDKAIKVTGEYFPKKN